MDYKGQTRSGEKVAELRPPVAPIISPETQHAVGNLGNTAMNPEFLSKKDNEAAKDPANFEVYLPKDKQSNSETSTAQAEADIVDFNSIRTGNQLSNESVAQVKKAIDNLGKNTGPAAFAEQVSDMVEANIKNSYGRILGESGKAA